MAGLYYQMNRFDEALAKYLEAIQIDGENFLRSYLAGQIYRMKGEVGNAITFFEKSLEQDPPIQAPGNMKLMAMVELVKLYGQAEQEEKVLELSEKILKLDPNNRMAFKFRDQILHKQRTLQQKKKWKNILDKYQ